MLAKPRNSMCDTGRGFSTTCISKKKKYKKSINTVLVILAIVSNTGWKQQLMLHFVSTNTKPTGLQIEVEQCCLEADSMTPKKRQKC